MIALALLLVVIVLVVIGIRSASGRGRGAEVGSHAVRRFFQYLLLYGLLVVATIGVAGLLGRLFDTGTLLLEGGEEEVALNLAFTVVGVPLYAAVALWSRQRLAADPGEAASFGWMGYTLLASMTALVTAMGAWYGVLTAVAGLRDYDGYALASALVWGAVWAAHWWVSSRVTPQARDRLHRLLGSLVGLGTTLAGLSLLLAGGLQLLFGTETTLVGPENQDLLRGACVLAVGAPIWAVYWLGSLSRAERDPIWLGYVLLAGVGAGLVMTISAASVALYDALVWMVGDPSTTDAARHFENAPTEIAVTLVGLLSWWYHRAQLSLVPREGRSPSPAPGEPAAVEAPTGAARPEVRRVYEYLMAGIGLAAGAVGLTLLLVALIEAVSSGEAIVAGSGAVNTLIAALTLIVVGGPVWWWFWHRIEAVAHRPDGGEQASPTRRVFLVILFGVGGVAAVVALLVAVYLFAQDALDGRLGMETFRSMRVALGVLVTTGLVSGYHWTVYAADRRVAPPTEAPHGPRYVLLIGPHDPSLARAVEKSTGGRVQTWPRTDNGHRAWTPEEVLDALGETDEQEVIVLEENDGLHAIPVHRT